MRKVLSLAIILACLVLFSQCKKDDKNTYNIATYAETDSSELFLFVNDQSKGKLPYLDAGADDCNDGSALKVSLPAGNYTFTAKDQQGNIKASVTVTLDDNEIDVDWITGTNTAISFDRCGTLGLGY